MERSFVTNKFFEYLYKDGYKNYDELFSSLLRPEAKYKTPFVLAMKKKDLSILL